MGDLPYFLEVDIARECAEAVAPPRRVEAVIYYAQNDAYLAKPMLAKPNAQEADAEEGPVALSSRPVAVGLLVVECIAGIAAFAFGTLAALGALHDTTDFSLLGIGLAAAAVWVAAARYRQEWSRHLLILVLLVLSVALSAFDLGSAHGWFA